MQHGAISDGRQFQIKAVEKDYKTTGRLKQKLKS